MSERPAIRVNYKWVRATFVVIALMIPAVLFKSYSAGIMNFFLLLPFMSLVGLWQAYQRSQRALLELPSDTLASAQNLPETLCGLALTGGYCLLIGLSIGLLLGKSIIH